MTSLRGDHGGLLWILEGREVKPCPPDMDWTEWFYKADRRVAYDESEDGSVQVSTVFLGLDHSFRAGAPSLFETMIFGGPFDRQVARYSTWNEAEVGHAILVGICIGAKGDDDERRRKPRA